VKETASEAEEWEEEESPSETSPSNKGFLSMAALGKSWIAGDAGAAAVAGRATHGKGT
jgi:hypothetical protein